MAAEDLQAIWADLADAQGRISHRPLSSLTPHGPVLVGVDDRGVPHLLVPIGPDGTVTADNRSRGVVLVSQHLMAGGEEAVFADLVCVDPGLQRVFAQLCDDIVERISGSPEQALASVHAALNDWREMFRSPERPERMSAVGVRGELEVLRELSRSDPTEAWSSWTGPLGAVHDFTSAIGALEIKTTEAAEGHRVTIHGVHQVDPPAAGGLWIVLLRLGSQPGAGESINQIVDDLVGLGVPRSALARRMRDLGFPRDGDQGPADETWVTLERTIWPVGEDFPGLRASQLGMNRLRGITRVRYELDLDAASAPLDEPAAAAIWGAFVGATRA